MIHKLSVCTFLLLSGVYFNVNVQSNPIDGKAIFENKCSRCHGADGTKGEYGAKNLRKSVLNDEKLFKTISNGGWVMPRWKKELSPEQIMAVINYIKTFRTK